jgi:hypothetical protein
MTYAQYPDVAPEPSPVRALRIRSLRLHDSRHTWATLALQAGRNVRWVADVLGHANPGFTLQVCGHVLRDQESDLGFLGIHGWNSTETGPLVPALDGIEDVSDSEALTGGRAPTRTGDPLLVRSMTTLARTPSCVSGHAGGGKGLHRDAPVTARRPYTAPRSRPGEPTDSIRLEG